MFMTLLIAERHLPCNLGNGHGEEKGGFRLDRRGESNYFIRT